MREILPVHGQRDHRCNGPDPIPVLIHLAISTTLLVRRFVVTDDLGGTFLRSVHASVSTPGSGTSTFVVVKDPDGTPVPLQTTDTTIDSSETTSYTAATPHVMDDSGTPAENYMLQGDVIEVTVTLGSGADDPTALLLFGPNIIRLTP